MKILKRTNNQAKIIIMMIMMRILRCEGVQCYHYIHDISRIVHSTMNGEHILSSLDISVIILRHQNVFWKEK